MMTYVKLTYFLYKGFEKNVCLCAEMIFRRDMRGELFRQFLSVMFEPFTSKIDVKLLSLTTVFECKIISLYRAVCLFYTTFFSHKWRKTIDRNVLM